MHFRLNSIYRIREIRIGILLSLFVFSANAQVKWDGGAGDGLWSSATNWVGDMAPVSGDNVLLDNSAMSGNYTVTLPGGVVGTSLSTLVITPSSGNTINLILPSGNVATPGLAITGVGDAIILNNGAVFQNSSGASSGSTFDITGMFRINNGGHYIHNTDRSNASIVSQLSTVAGTETGIFEFKVPATPAISASGRNYGTLILSTNGGTKTYTVPSGVSPLTIRGDFIINSNTNLTWSAAANIVVNGKLKQSSISTFNLSSGVSSPSLQIKGDVHLAGTLTETGSGIPVIELNGTTNQNISITGSINNSIDFKVNNSAGVTLASPVTLPTTLSLVSGNIHTSSINILALSANAIVAGGSSASFIEGPMQKTGNTAFTFPVGVGSIYAPITIRGGGYVSYIFTAEYKRKNPQTTIGNGVVSGLDHVSYVEYWSLQQNMGSTAKQVSLQVNSESFCKMLATVFVSRYNGSQWTNEGNDIVSGPFVSGNYQSGTLRSGVLSNFGNFTLSTNQPYGVNPLPLKLISFKAVKVKQGQVELNWQLAEANIAGAQLVVQRAIGDSNYKDIATLNWTLNGAYTFVDNADAEGLIYYRLKMIHLEGTVNYSKIESVTNEKNNLHFSLKINGISPSSATIELQSDRSQPIQFLLIDMQGRILRQWSKQANKGKSFFDLSVVKILPGIYCLVAVNTNGEKISTMFITQ